MEFFSLAFHRLLQILEPLKKLCAVVVGGGWCPWRALRLLLASHEKEKGSPPRGGLLKKALCERIVRFLRCRVWRAFGIWSVGNKAPRPKISEISAKGAPDKLLFVLFRHLLYHNKSYNRFLSISNRSGGTLTIKHQCKT